MNSKRKFLRVIALGGVLSMVLVSAALAATFGKISNVHIEEPKTNAPRRVVAAPDGSIWYTTNVVSGNPLPGGPRETVGRISPAGDVVEAVTPTFFSFPGELTIGPDGAVWFTEPSAGKIGRAVFESGQIQITEFRVTDGTLRAGGIPDIVTGPDNDLWMTDVGSNENDRVWRFDEVTEVFTPFLLGANTNPGGITVGADGNLWFTEQSSLTNPGEGSIARMTTAGVIDRFDPDGNPFLIQAGPDGALWFTENFGNRVGRITTAGVTTYPALSPGLSVPPASPRPFGIASDMAANRIYVTERGTGSVMMIDLSGGTEPFPTASTKALKDSQPEGVTVDGNGNVWWAQFGDHKISRVTVEP